MITDAIIKFFLAALNSLLTLIPALSFPEMPAAATGIGNMAMAFSRIAPLGFMLQCLTATILMEIALWSFDGAVFMFHQIHGSD